MQENNLIAQLRTAPQGSQFMLHGFPWHVEENSLFLNEGFGKAVLLSTIKIFGKVASEKRRIIEIGFSPHSGKRNFTHTHSEKLTRWGMLVEGSFFAVITAAIIGSAVVIGQS